MARELMPEGYEEFLHDLKERISHARRCQSIGS
jgi:hypothetical protein